MALDELNIHLSSILVLVPPEPGEKLQLYISATTQVVSTVLTVDREEDGHVQKVQHSVYFVSEVLNASKIRYQ